MYGILYLSIFRKSVEKIKILLKSDKINGTLHEDQYSLLSYLAQFCCHISLSSVVISRSVLLSYLAQFCCHISLSSVVISRSVPPRMRKLTEKRCREYEYTLFLFNNFFFSKIVPFMRESGKIF